MLRITANLLKDEDEGDDEDRDEFDEESL